MAEHATHWYTYGMPTDIDLGRRFVHRAKYEQDEISVSEVPVAPRR